MLGSRTNVRDPLSLLYEGNRSGLSPLLCSKKDDLAIEDFLESMDRGCSSSTSDRGGERDFFRADGNAVLSIAASLDSTFSRESLKTLTGNVLAGGMCIK